jgi:hypothetical protein
VSRRVSKALLRSKLGRELLAEHPGPDAEHEETSAPGVDGFRSEMHWPTLTTEFERSLEGVELPEDHWSYTDYDEGEEP